MKSFLPTLTSLCRLRTCTIHGPNLRHARSMGLSTEAHPESLAVRPSRPNHPAEISLTKYTKFEDLGLHSPIIAALHLAFPNVKHPTETQSKFIPAILSGKDVLLKDETGSGKSFGIVVSLMNKPQLVSKKSGPYLKKYITSLVLVPHRDLAYQLYHWIKQIATTSPELAPKISSLAQVLVRDGTSHLTNGIRDLHQHPPHILIGTPQAILDIYKEDPQALQLSHLSSVVVDEVDYLIETVPKKDPRKSFHKSTVKAERKLLAHPGVTRQLLDVIFSKRKETNERRRDEPGAAQHRRRNEIMDPHSPAGSPQLILSSATLRSHLNNYLFDESGWLNRDYLLKVKGTKKSLTKVDAKVAVGQESHDGLGGNGIQHSVLVVSNDGIQNIAGARAPSKTPEDENLQPINAETLFTSFANSEPANNDPQLIEKYRDQASPFNPNAFEAIATAFALDVPSLALMVIPASSSVPRAVYELREMGINAHGLDLLSEGKGRSHLLRDREISQDNPTLLVATLATTRGLDLPELTHCFILGIPDGPKINGRTVDAYVHLAGRVGRFGRSGKVITVVEKGKEEEGVRAISEETKMLRILDTIQETPVQFEHFD